MSKEKKSKLKEELEKLGLMMLLGLIIGGIFLVVEIEKRKKEEKILKFSPPLDCKYLGGGVLLEQYKYDEENERIIFNENGNFKWVELEKCEIINESKGW